MLPCTAGVEAAQLLEVGIRLLSASLGGQQQPEASMGDSILKSFAANDFAGLCEDDATLLEAVLSISPALQLEQRFSRDNDAWDEGTSVLKLDNPLPMECEVDLPVLAFINQIDGKRTVRESIARFTKLTGTDVAELSTQLLPAVRLFISNGFLEPTDA